LLAERTYGTESPDHAPPGMSNDDKQRLSEEMAARLWQRAAELQSEAAKRIEATSRLAAEAEISEPDTSGYALGHVRQAAEEAGIAGEFVDAALAEVTAHDVAGHHKNSVMDSLAQRILGTGPEFLEVRRVVAAPAEDIYKTMQGSFPAPPYNLSLRDIRGDVLRGGVMVFDVPSITALSYTSFEYEMSWASLKQIMVSIHPVGEESCEVVVRSSVRFYRRLGGGLGTALASAAGLGGGVFGVGLGLAVGTGLGLATAGLVPFVGGLALLAGGTLGTATRPVFRKLYGYGLGRGLRGLEGLLGALNVAVIAGWGAGSPSRDDAGQRGWTRDELGGRDKLSDPGE